MAVFMLAFGVTPAAVLAFDARQPFATKRNVHSRFRHSPGARDAWPLFATTSTSSGGKKSSKAESSGDEEGAALTLAQAKSLQAQAQQLKEEADRMRQQLDDEKERALIQRQTKIDGWIDELLIQMEMGTDDEDTPKIQLLKTVEQVLERLQDDRYSQEQINAIFNRICETGPKQSRSNCSPIMELLVDAVGKMDEVERAENPNKRWSGRVERVLRKRLFDMDWNMDSNVQLRISGSFNGS